jgi:hypothetical protein
MTTPPADGEPPADMNEPLPEAPSGADDMENESDDTDAMGIDDDDPLDATLVGKPLEDGDDVGASTEPAGRGSGSGSGSDAGPESDAASQQDRS